MFNPFVAFDSRYLALFRQKAVVAFVRQTYDRGKNLLSESEKPSYLLAHYNLMESARNHYDALVEDAARRLYVVANPDDWRELEKLCGAHSGAYVYAYLKVKDAEQKARKMLDKKLRTYIDYKLGWRPGRSTVKFDLEFSFGQVYAVLRLGAMTHKVSIEEIEKIKRYVL